MMGEGEEGMDGRKDERSEGGGEGGKEEERKKGRISWSLLEPELRRHVSCCNVYSRRKVR